MHVMPLKKLLDNKAKNFLLELARKSIKKVFNPEIVLPKPFNKNLEGICEKRTGCFVTLSLNSVLRGCIGCINSSNSLYECVKENAVKAAFYDDRFLPLTEKELKKTVIEISVLSPQKELKGTWQKKFDSIKKGFHGIILDFGFTSSVFLPSVWKELPDKKSFLSNLCLKAGMPTESWKKARIFCFTSISFSEKKA